MSMLRPFLAQDLTPTDVLPGSGRWMGLTLKELTLVFGAVGLVTLLLFIWAVYFRKRPHSHSHQHHHSHSSDEASVSSMDTESETSGERRYRRKRRRRREHRPRNPTWQKPGDFPRFGPSPRPIRFPEHGAKPRHYAQERVQSGIGVRAPAQGQA